MQTATPDGAVVQRPVETTESSLSESREPLWPGFSEPTQGERFLQQALGTQGDVRIPALALTLVLLLAVIVVAAKRWRRGARSWRDLDDFDEALDDTGEPLE